MKEKFCKKCGKVKTYSSFYKKWICEFCLKINGGRSAKENIIKIK